MRILLVLLVSLISLSLSAQDFLSLYKEYSSYCNELVPDTITISGEFIQKAVPVYDEAGNIISYIMVSCGDTIWDEPKCKKYLTIREFEWDYFTISDTISYWGYFSKQDISCNRVTKKHICWIPREGESWDGFILWLKKSGKL